MKYLNQFLNYLKTLQFNKSTIRSYYYAIKKPQKYFNSKNLIDEKMINEKDIEEYLFNVKNNEKISIHRLFLYLKRYFKYLENERIIFINPCENIDVKKDSSVHTKPLPLNEMPMILYRIKAGNFYGIRSKAIIETLYSTAMRPFELTNLKILDVDFNNKEIFIEKGKFSKDRIVPVGKTALFWIKKYLNKVRPNFVKDQTNNYLFISMNRSGKKLAVRGLQQIFQNTLEINKIKHFKLYSLRASCAYHCLLKGMNVLYIQKLLGHENVYTTKSYLMLETVDLQKVIKSHHPRNKFQIKGENYEI